MSRAADESERELRVDVRRKGGTFEAARGLWAAAASCHARRCA